MTTLDTTASPSSALPALRQRRHTGILRVFDGITYSAAIGGSLLLVAMLTGMIAILFQKAYPAMTTFGWGFFTSVRWNPVRQIFGAWPFIYSTLVTSGVALLIAVPVSVGTAIFLVKIAPRIRIAGMPSAPIVNVVSFLVELLAAIPSIAYGLWGVAVLVPFMHDYVQPFLGRTLGQVPGIGFLFANPGSGFSILTASIVLAIMIIPIITAIVRDVLAVAPPELEQGALGLGATWWQSMRLILGFCKMGIFGAVVLGLARAMGETMAVTMVIGAVKPSSLSLFSQGHTISSLLANQFANADTDAEFSAIVYVALILLLITTFINGVARATLMRVTMKARRR